MRWFDRQDRWAWLFLGAVLVLCSALGVLQYRWIGDVSRRARDQLQANILAALGHFNDDLQRTVAAELRNLLPTGTGNETSDLERQITSRYVRWKATSPRRSLLARIAIVKAGENTPLLRIFNPDKSSFVDAEWPEQWISIRGRPEPGRPAPARTLKNNVPRLPLERPALVIELPLREDQTPQQLRNPQLLRSAPRLIFELDYSYLRDTLLPELLHAHFGEKNWPEIEIAILSRNFVPITLYPADPAAAQRIAEAANLSMPLFDPQMLFSSRLPTWGAVPQLARPARGPGFGSLWQAFVHHRAGSLEAAVAGVRRRNLAAAAAILFLLAASATALLRLTRQAQRLAEMQVEFVAGISHELRTPLTVIHTAAFNLRGKLAEDPARVEKYGELIQRESSRLAQMVDQVLQFAGLEKRTTVQNREAVTIGQLLEEAIDASRSVIETAGCTVEREIASNLQAVEVDRESMARALANLLCNAAKYGAEPSHWIGVTASHVEGRERGLIEIKIMDRGPGIPAEELKHIFEPFYRGRRALKQQIHGAGLGLSLAKRIIEGHGGSITARSVPYELTEFIVRLPAKVHEESNEGANSVG